MVLDTIVLNIMVHVKIHWMATIILLVVQMGLQQESHGAGHHLVLELMVADRLEIQLATVEFLD